MPVIEIKPDVYWIGVNDRITDLFESLWPIIGEGVAYNAYLISDQKKAIIDSVKSFKGNEFLHQIEEIVDISQIDYIIINHMEPDHSGTLDTLQRVAPQITFLGTPKNEGGVGCVLRYQEKCTGRPRWRNPISRQKDVEIHFHADGALARNHDDP